MKEIPNKSTSLPIKADGSPVTFLDFLKEALDSMPPGGFDPATLRARARVDKAIAGINPGDLIKLEDADYDTAQAAVKALRWTTRNSDCIAFIDAFGV
jgi:hypothetical protein